MPDKPIARTFEEWKPKSASSDIEVHLRQAFEDGQASMREQLAAKDAEIARAREEERLSWNASQATTDQMLRLRADHQRQLDECKARIKELEERSRG